MLTLAQWRRRKVPIGHLTNAVHDAIWGLTDLPFDREHFAESTARMPGHFVAAVATKYASEHRAHGNREANGRLYDLRDALTATGLRLAAGDDEICDAAEQRAKSVQYLLLRQELSESGAVRAQMERYARSHGVRPPDAKTLQGVVGRMSDARWWRRALRREVAREVERHAVRLGLVHKRASLYASAEAVQRRRGQKRRNARVLEATEAVNESGQVYTLAELASKNVSNPKVRRVELMVRMRGFEEFAAQAGHVGMFYTWTAPSRMHAVLAASCQPNPKFDGTSPREAQDYLRRQWAKCRSALDRAGVFVYGVRVAEPHHDGTPHWHLLFFMPRGVVAFVTETMRRYACASDAAELDGEAAQRARFHAVAIDASKGSATGYVAKYIAKNIDAKSVGEDLEGEPGTDAAATVTNVDAWAATWGIRQFQQIGGPGVTVWRELRRLRQAPQLPLFDRFWEAADSHTWRDFVRLMNGAACRRRDRALALWRVEHDEETRYGEAAPAKVEGVRHVVLEHCRTRFQQWEVRHAGAIASDRAAATGVGGDAQGEGDGRALRRSVRQGNERGDNGGGNGVAVAVQRARHDERGAGVGGFGVPWTRVNNCTDVDSVRDFERSFARLGAPPGGAP